MNLLAQVPDILGTLLVLSLPIVWSVSTLVALWHLLRRRMRLARFWGATSLGLIALVVLGVIGFFVLGNIWVGCSLHGGCPTPRSVSYYIYQALFLIYSCGVLAWGVRRMLFAKRIVSS
jgi:hypothetical protein